MAAVVNIRPSARRDIPVRRLDVEHSFDEVSDRWLVEDDPILSHFLAVLSAVFPRGEEFFVASVRHHRAAVAGDPVLRAQVKGFTGQEAMHGREHRALNARLGELGYPTARAEAGVGRICDVLVGLPPRTLPIAVTAASEHFTGILAEAALGHRSTREVLFGHDAIQPLICWHALEELEHKNVAFDVLGQAGGGYLVRVAGLGVAAVVLGGFVAVEWARAVLADRTEIGRRQLFAFARNLRRQKLLSPWALRQALRYLRPDFHPDDMDTDHLVVEWRARLAATTTELSTLMRSA